MWQEAWQRRGSAQGAVSPVAGLAELGWVLGTELTGTLTARAGQGPVNGTPGRDPETCVGRAGLCQGRGPGRAGSGGPSRRCSSGRRWRRRRGGDGQRAPSSGSSPATPGAAGRGTAAPKSRPGPEQRSAMAAEEADGLAMSRPHYGCEYRPAGTARPPRSDLPGDALPGQRSPALQGPVPEWRLGRRRPGGLRDRGSGTGPRGRLGRGRSAGAERRGRGSSSGLDVPPRAEDRAVAGQCWGVSRLSRRRLPRAGSAPRPRCPPRAGQRGAGSLSPSFPRTAAAARD